MGSQDEGRSMMRSWARPFVAFLDNWGWLGVGWPREYDVVIEVGVLLEHPGIIHCWKISVFTVYIWHPLFKWLTWWSSSLVDPIKKCPKRIKLNVFTNHCFCTNSRLLVLAPMGDFYRKGFWKETCWRGTICAWFGSVFRSTQNTQIKSTRNWTRVEYWIKFGWSKKMAKLVLSHVQS